jgi:hypothetical protein
MTSNELALVSLVVIGIVSHLVVVGLALAVMP